MYRKAKLILLIIFELIAGENYNNNIDKASDYSDYIVIEVHEGKNHKAFKEASLVGLQHHGEVGSLQNYYLFKKKRNGGTEDLQRDNGLELESNKDQNHTALILKITKNLETHHAIKTVLPQKYFKRSKRVGESIGFNDTFLRISKMDGTDFNHSLRKGDISFNDPLYPKQWNIHGRSESEEGKVQ